jgi:hypothetical protein
LGVELKSFGIEDMQKGNTEGDKKEEVCEEIAASLFDEEGDEKKAIGVFEPIPEEIKQELSEFLFDIM